MFLKVYGFFLQDVGGNIKEILYHLAITSENHRITEW